MRRFPLIWRPRKERHSRHSPPRAEAERNRSRRTRKRCSGRDSAGGQGRNVAVIADTGPLYALADADDEYHEIVKAVLSRNRDALLVASPVVVEGCYLIL